jgi:predicted nucleic acid-binding protein
MVLADTSIWIHHFRESSATLVGLLEANQVAIHPHVIGELACGNLRRRKEAILDLEILPRTAVPGYNDVMEFIERYKLSGKGIGFVDANLLASCSHSEALLWTRDLRLRKIALDLEIGFKEN